ncbi:hypothetical protein BD410DRAFT_840765 [Rickenella mellea]|uniref:Ricin B lectin domain-containing protein n=1 Tax=Rickenella mellea TaxID=50990 RepID=A0A4Y7Q077_9AGAM|nr:hypothetical protein BD410DRAFT_840765 [Rickenella mellea]
MSIDPGAYIIQNVTHRNFAAQSAGTTVVAYTESRSRSITSVTSSGEADLNLRKVWSISRLNNDKYTIRNIETNEYAATSTFPAIEQSIITTQALRQWDIKETAVRGRYVICTNRAKSDLYWGLTDDELDTPITLRDSPNTPSNQWELTKVDLWVLLGHMRAKLVGLRHDYVELQNAYSELSKRENDKCVTM